MRACLIAIALVLGMAATTVPQTNEQIKKDDPLLGTWVLNVAKSSFKLNPAVKSEMRTYALVGQEIKVTSTAVMASGKTVKGSWTVVFDGKDRPMAGSDTADSISLTRTDPFHGTAVEKRNGKVVSMNTRVISANGKTMTITSKGTNVKGESVTDVMVLDKK
jgi:hypothetical protein